MRLSPLSPLCTPCMAVVLVLSGCAEPPPTEQELAAIREHAGALSGDLADIAVDDRGGVVVRLIFDADVDLDLYVTDPLLDTTYFARHESRIGGQLTKDVRCDTQGPRIEEVRFAQLWPGAYRVGVDFPQRCDGRRSKQPAPYAVRVSANGEQYEVHGTVNQEFFEVEVLKFTVAEGQ